MVILDRDGVINRNRDDYVKSVDEFEFLPGSREAVRRLTEAGLRVVVVSNQQAVGKGLMSPETLEEIDRMMKAGISEAGGRIDAAYYCPHLKEENCECRKPETGLLRRASRDFGVPLSQAVLIGDSPSDIEAGKRAGCHTIAVLSGKLSAEEIDDLTTKPDEVAANLEEAAELVLGAGKEQAY